MKRKSKQNADFRLIDSFGHRSPEAEAYKILRTNLQFLTVDKEVKTILFTSTAPDEGKSTTAANLALTLAAAGKNVLLVDCDLRMPVQHKIFNVLNNSGLTNILAENIAPADCIRAVPGYDLRLLSSGPLPPNPAELLDSERMSRLMNELKQRYDYVLIDAPPILAVTDAIILGSKVDGVILVSSIGSTNIDKAKEAKETLIKGQARILGVVLNGVERSGDDEYYYYYYGKES